MVLEPNCIRDLLFSIESNSSCNSDIRFPGNLFNHLSDKYTEDQMKYHLKQMGKNGLIEIKMENILNELVINDLTPKGHELCAQIRSDKVWKKILKKLPKFSLTLLDLTKTASSIYFGLNG